MKFPAKDAIKNIIIGTMNKLHRDSEGVVLAAVLIFISLILPVTLIILNSVEIETMLPTNEGFGRIASHEADKGFDMAMSALLADNQDGFFGSDIMVDPTRPVPSYFPQYIGSNDSYYVIGMVRGRHDIDYLAEPWARHPDNYTYFLAEHSMENTEHPDWNPDPPGEPDEYSIPTRWVMMNVPFGMDDHGEITIGENNYPDILTNMENGPSVSPVTPVNAFAVDTTEDDEMLAPPIYVHEDWRLSPSHPNFAPPRYIARPASYFRNTTPGYAAANAFYDNRISDSLVYDSSHDDADGDGVIDNPVQTQYLPNPKLQEAVSDSTWSNVHYGSGAQAPRNKEYKPLPGTVTQYPVGSTGEDFIPAWFESICSDESSRFNLNTILNVIFQGANYDYQGNYTNEEDATLENPQVRYDWWDERTGTTGRQIGDYINIFNDIDHPNYSNLLLAMDMVASLLMEDEDLKSQSQYDKARERAKWILQNMMIVRERLDINYDADSNGEPDIIDLNFPNGDSITSSTDIKLTGRGRMGDAPRPWQGTWQVYKNPKDFMNDPGLYGYSLFQQGYRPITDEDFKILHGACTVYSYETEHIADAPSSGANDDDGYRWNFNEIDQNNVLVTQKLNTLIGNQRVQSLFNWRDGLVDLNADGDLNDEFILQPVKVPGTAEPETNLRSDARCQPISEITYRERRHYNYQNPRDPEYPNMLNIPDLGSLLTVPMSARQTQIVSSMIDLSTSTTSLGMFNPTPPVPVPGVMIPNTDSGDEPYVTDIDFSGTQVLFDELNALEEFGTVDVPRGLNYVFPSSSAEGYHPSFNPDATQFLYVDKDTTNPGGRTISTWDIVLDQRVYTNLNGNVALAQMLNMPTPLGGEYLEPASPDWSPTGRYMAFSGGGVFDVDDPFGDHVDIYLVRMSGPSIGIPDNITNLRDGQYAFYPDFSPDGQWLAYTLIDIREFTRPNPRPFKIRIQNVFNNTTQDIPRRGGSDIIDNINGWVLGIQLIPFAPDWSPDGNNLCYMGFTLGGGLPDIYTISRGNTTTTRNITNTGAIAEMFPCWGYAMTVAAYQKDDAPGGAPPSAIAYPPGGINSAGDPWDADLRQQLAEVLQNASLALRMSLDDGVEQNWRYMDLPVVPQHMVEPLQVIADMLCFRSPYYTDPTDVTRRKYPYAYPGKININTAPRKVLRSLFLMMFQGSIIDYDESGGTDTGLHGCAPIAESGFTMDPTPINLCANVTTPYERLLAICIADTYAHQVDEYRRWIYNNQSRSFEFDAYGNSNTFSITPETVPDEYVNPPTSIGERIPASYRANPFLPYDTDNNPFTQERPMYDPEPPFRSIADLFNITLYTGEFDEDWLLEGFDNQYGPDPEEEISVNGDNFNVVPTAWETDDNKAQASFDNALDGPNALAVWGPIYQTQYTITDGLAIATTEDYTLTNWFNYEGGRGDQMAPGSWYYKQQRFRMFSADDFKWIAPYITTRSYTYRVESRGTVRVANGTNKLDITRDKFWVVDFGNNAYVNFNTTGWEANPMEPINVRTPINGNDSNEPYVVRAFEETPVDGISLTRRFFSPPPK